MTDPLASRDRNFYLSDTELQHWLGRCAPGLAERETSRLAGFGAWVGGEVDAAASYTDRFAPPVLDAQDNDGRLLTRVVCNPRYAAVHRQAYENGMIGLSHGPSAGPHLLGFTMGYLLAQGDISIHCPITLTGAVAYVLDRFAPEPLKSRYLPGLTRQDGRAWTGATRATERQGGSGQGAAATTARA